MKPRTYLILAGIAILAIWMLKDAVCTPGTVITLNIDSISAKYEKAVDSITALQKIQDGRILDLNFQRRQDSAAIARAIIVGKASNQKLSAAIEANKALKAQNDTLARLNNCDTMAVYAGRLQVAFDSVASLNEHQQNATNELVFMYDDALKSANDKAIMLTKERDEIRATIRQQIIQAEPSSPFRFGFHGGYGISSGGLSPVLSVGINYEIRPRSILKSLFKRKP